MDLKTSGIITGAIAALLLSGCSASGADNEPSSEASEPANKVYEFKTPAYGSEAELTVQIPQDLKDVAPESKELLVESVTMKARELESAKYCAVDFTPAYTEGALEELKQPRYTRDESNAAAEDELATILRQELGAATVEEYSENYQSSNGTPPSETDIADFEEDKDELAANYTKSTSNEYIETSEMENVTDWITDSKSDDSIEDLDAADPEPGTYTSDDLKTVTLVQSCAESQVDDSAAREFTFPYLGESSKPSTFASIEVTVMKDGSLTIPESSVGDYKLDSNGSWLAK